jgi:hypothetical protein
MPRSIRPRQSAGLAEPKFIVKLGDKYYVTLSVLEYDPNAPGASQAQKDGAAQIAAAFAGGQPKLQAVQVAPPQVTAHMQTFPQH